eukprot:364582-Chlamydomonas_euryale.AAC.1
MSTCKPPRYRVRTSIAGRCNHGTCINDIGKGAVWLFGCAENVPLQPVLAIQVRRNGPFRGQISLHL